MRHRGSNKVDVTYQGGLHGELSLRIHSSCLKKWFADCAASVLGEGVR